jgi:hypothetical protein
MSELIPTYGSVPAGADARTSDAAVPEAESSEDAGEATPVTVLWADDRAEVKLTNPRVTESVVWGSTDHDQFTTSKTYDLVVGAAMEPARLTVLTERDAGGYRLRFSRR